MHAAGGVFSGTERAEPPAAEMIQQCLNHDGTGCIEDAHEENGLHGFSSVTSAIRMRLDTTRLGGWERTERPARSALSCQCQDG